MAGSKASLISPAEAVTAGLKDGKTHLLLGNVHVKFLAKQTNS